MRIKRFAGDGFEVKARANRTLALKLGDPPRQVEADLSSEAAEELADALYAALKWAAERADEGSEDE